MIIFDTRQIEWEGQEPVGYMTYHVYDEGIIKYQLQGPYTADLVEISKIAHPIALAKIKQKEITWFSLQEYCRSEELTDEFIESLGAYLKYLVSKNLMAGHVALVFSNPQHRDVGKEEKLKKCFDDIMCQSESFGSEEEAVKWIRSIQQAQG